MIYLRVYWVKLSTLLDTAQMVVEDDFFPQQDRITWSSGIKVVESKFLFQCPLEV